MTEPSDAAETRSESDRSLRDRFIAWGKAWLRGLYHGPENTVDERAVYLRAEEIEHETTLSTRESVVLAGMEEGLDDGEIGLLIGRSPMTVEHTKAKLRQRERDLDTEMSKAETEKELLGDATA